MKRWTDYIIILAVATALSWAGMEQIQKSKQYHIASTGKMVVKR